MRLRRFRSVASRFRTRCLRLRPAFPPQSRTETIASYSLSPVAQTAPHVAFCRLPRLRPLAEQEPASTGTYGPFGTLESRGALTVEATRLTYRNNRSARGHLPPIAATLNKVLKRDAPGGSHARALSFFRTDDRTQPPRKTADDLGAATALTEAFGGVFSLERGRVRYAVRFRNSH